MRMETFRYLLELEKSRSLNATSQKMHISVQALSSAIRHMEDELDVTLLNRSNRGVTFTREGQLVLDHVRKIVTQYDEMCMALRECRNNSQGAERYNLLIYSNHVFYDSILPSRIQQFEHLHPNVSVIATRAEVPVILSNLHKHRTDRHTLCLGVAGLPGTNPEAAVSSAFAKDIHIRPFSHSNVVAVVSGESPLACCQKVSAKTLARGPVIIYSPASPDNNAGLKMVHEHASADVAMAVFTWDSLLNAVKKDLGTGLVNSIVLDSDSAIKNIPPEVKIVQIREPTPIANCFLLKDENDPIIKSFMELFYQ